MYALTQDQLAHTLFPIGNYHKSQRGFINAHKHDSQDICFVQNKRYDDFIQKYTGHSYPSENFIDTDGNILGKT